MSYFEIWQRKLRRFATINGILNPIQRKTWSGRKRKACRETKWHLEHEQREKGGEMLMARRKIGEKSREGVNEKYDRFPLSVII